MERSQDLLQRDEMQVLEELFGSLQPTKAQRETEEHRKLEEIKKDPKKLRQQLALCRFEIGVAQGILQFVQSSGGDKELVNKITRALGEVLADAQEEPVEQAKENLVHLQTIMAELQPYDDGEATPVYTEQ